ncbi:MAG: hypothetical protein AABZ34_06205, partial [Nitrospirota bacterium]
MSNLAGICGKVIHICGQTCGKLTHLTIIFEQVSVRKTWGSSKNQMDEIPAFRWSLSPKRRQKRRDSLLWIQSIQHPGKGNRFPHVIEPT